MLTNLEFNDEPDLEEICFSDIRAKIKELMRQVSVMPFTFEVPLRTDYRINNTIHDSIIHWDENVFA